MWPVSTYGERVVYAMQTNTHYGWVEVRVYYYGCEERVSEILALKELTKCGEVWRWRVRCNNVRR